MRDQNNDFYLLSKKSDKYVGFTNISKENSCYVNVILQSLFHFSEFRNRFVSQVFDEKNEALKVLIELQKIIQDYKLHINNDVTNENIALDSLVFRKELSIAFEKQALYNLNENGDPMELLNNLLKAYHTYLNNKKCKDVFISDPPSCKSNCFVHQLFQLLLMEETNCLTCKGKKSERIRYDSNLFSFVLYTKEILRFIKINDYPFDEINESLFIISQEVRDQVNIQCDKCKQILYKTLNCEYIGRYFLVNCAWTNDEKVRMEHIIKIYYMIPLFTNCQDVFECKKRINFNYELSGLVLYWLNHYVCAFKKGNRWIFYDDAKITELNSWEDLVRYLIKNHYRPVGLFYQQIDNKQCKKKIDSKLTQNEFKEALEYFKVIEADLAKIEDNKEIPIENVKDNKNEGEQNEEDSKEEQVLNKELKIDTKDQNETIDTNSNTNQKIESKTETDNIQSNAEQECLNEKEKKNDLQPTAEPLKVINYDDTIQIKTIKTNEWVCDNKNCGSKNEYSQYKCKNCKKENENAKLVYEKEMTIQKKALSKNIEKKKSETIKYSSINSISKRKCSNEINKKEAIKQENDLECNNEDKNIKETQIKCPHCNFDNNSSSVKSFYCSKVVFPKVVNIENKQENEKVTNNLLENIKEDEWVCKLCDSINSNKTYRCKKCKETDENIFYLIQEKVKIEPKDDICSQVGNEMRELNEDEWRCDKCLKINNYDSDKCLYCKRRNTYVFKIIQQEEMYAKGQINIEEYQVKSDIKIVEDQPKEDKETYWKCKCRVENRSEIEKCLDCNIARRINERCVDCCLKNKEQGSVCKECLEQYFCNTEKKEISNRTNGQKSAIKNQLVINESSNKNTEKTNDQNNQTKVNLNNENSSLTTSTSLKKSNMSQSVKKNKSHRKKK